MKATCRRAERRNINRKVDHDRTIEDAFNTARAMSRTLIILGLVIVAVGILWPWLGRIGIGRLPGDILIKREGFTLYVPLATGLLVSIVLSAILWLINR
ncbi:DUF2905 domain-containing protein [Rhizobium sp. BK251]|uniref:DUF2905 domain-containing protein n=1 Tax=Rhizobium sp. BK251 TaxID=2512125 RepID=UPI0032AF900D